ncbi:hypothetical protein EFR00_17560 [Rhizobium sophoriradicis]|uniref:hypothetical protein n=1 Tax=Rhizobium sophoriradicis TaxID=1535245 RepID=UPI000F79FE5D|nr:hypothetical protein [Rhizobium sophoriradicis]RSC01903.1 hypothetical protein EFR00_17560 [Rhizobium sophoriradicis]
MFGSITSGFAKLIGLLLKLAGKLAVMALVALGGLLLSVLKRIAEDTLMAEASKKRQRQMERDELRRLKLQKARRDVYDDGL